MSSVKAVFSIELLVALELSSFSPCFVIYIIVYLYILSERYIKCKKKKKKCQWNQIMFTRVNEVSMHCSHNELSVTILSNSFIGIWMKSWSAIFV